MRWLKRDMWKAGIALAGLLLFLILMVLVPMSASAYEGASKVAIARLVQATSTVDVTATITALNEEKLRQEIQQLKDQNEPDFPGWIRMNATILASTLVVVIGGLIGLFRWFGDRRAEREKRAEERFQTIVLGLGSKDRVTKINSAIMLRTFLQPGYKQFYRQVFDLTVAHLRLRKDSSAQSEPPNTSNRPLIVVSNKPLPPPQEPNPPVDSLSQALISAFKISYPLARKQIMKELLKPLLLPYKLGIIFAILIKRPDAILKFGRTYVTPNLLDAANVQLNNADLAGADLAEADLNHASLQRAVLGMADLRMTNLIGADMRKSNLYEADLRDAYLAFADLRKADLERVRNLEKVRTLEGTDLRGAKGLTKEQKEACKTKGAIIDEDTTDSARRPTASPPTPSQSTDAQTPSALPAQGSTPPPGTDGSSSTSSQPSAES